MKQQIIPLLLTLALFFNQCAKAEEEHIYLYTSNLGGIEVIKGMDLVGLVINKDTGKPIENVVVSDGYTVTFTDENGVYQFKRHELARHVYVSVPSEFKIPQKDGHVKFYSEINSSFDIFRHDFFLEPLANGKEYSFSLICVADIHIRDDETLSRFKNETISDIALEAKKHENVYAINLGDLVSDVPEYFPRIKEIFSFAGLPFFHVIGNHDFQPEEQESVAAAKAFEDNFGPINYTFNRGNAHIVIMNNNIYRGNKSYSRGFTLDQIKWLQSNLESVPKDKLLIIALHIPLRYDESIQRRVLFFNAIKGYTNTHIIAGHYHRNDYMMHEIIRAHEHTIAPASGMNWVGTVDRQGAPNGYSVFEITSKEITNWYYKSTLYPKEYQFRKYEPYSFGDKEGYVIANVWNADEHWNIQMYENNVLSGKMESFTGYDPGTFEFLSSTGRTIDISPDWYRKSNKLYRLKPKSSTSQITIIATDRFGNTYTQDQFVETIDKFRKYP